jgi:hypothetical protein
MDYISNSTETAFPQLLPEDPEGAPQARRRNNKQLQEKGHKTLTEWHSSSKSPGKQLIK